MEENIIVLASGNKGKIKEFNDMLSPFKVVGYKELGLDFEIEETGKTFYENALSKAQTVSKALNLPALADDSGLCVDALLGEPGVYSARYSGDGIDSHNIDKLLGKLKGEKNRNAKFCCSLVMYYPGGEIVSAFGETHGKILEERKGNNGFGYDSVFYSDDLNKSFGEATKEEKNSVSHRDRALQKLKALLGEKL